MSDFEYDVMTKKRVARGSFNRKCGSKSKRCCLPSDNLTNSQWKKRNGDVIVIQMDQPMSWKEFRRASNNLQKLYIQNLIDTYHADAGSIAKMFDVSRNTLSSVCKQIGISFSGNRGRSMSASQRDCWDTFCRGLLRVAEQSRVEADDVAQAMMQASEQSAVTSQDLAAALLPAEDVSRSSSTEMTSWSLSFNGVVDPDAIANSIRHMLFGERVLGSVLVKCELLPRVSLDGDNAE